MMGRTAHTPLVVSPSAADRQKVDQAMERFGLATTHDPNHALRHADEVVMLHDGHVHFRGPVDVAITRERLSALYGSEVTHIGDGRDRVYLPR